jgi:phosphate transport system substrate-binding protein
VIRLGICVLTLSLFLLACERPRDKYAVDFPLAGEGSTFAAPLYNVWINRYYAKTGQEVIYKPTGSSQGVEAVVTGRAVFGGSDAPLTPEQLQRTGEVVQIPTTLGAIAVVHNVGGAPANLHLTPEVLAGIFLCEITDWHDERITNLNPGVLLLPERIQVIHRSDGSGTTKVFTDYLSKVSPQWRERLGSGNSVEWPCGTGAKGNEGVTELVKRTSAAIGYVALNFARVARLPVAAIANRRGEFVEPSLESITAAAAAAVVAGQDPLQSIVDVDDEAAYPICTYSYVVMRRNQNNRAEARALSRFLHWAATEGQGYSSMLHYATLPPAVAEYAGQQLLTLRSKGEPLFDKPTDALAWD